MLHLIPNIPFTLIFLCCSSAATSPCLGQLTWSARQAELSASITDQQAQASYAFSNNTDHPITITNITTSCGCTTAKLEKKTYAPGESGDISVMFTIGDASGEQNKTIVVASDDLKDQKRGHH